jgi:hypothetical protein
MSLDRLTFHFSSFFGLLILEISRAFAAFLGLDQLFLLLLSCLLGLLRRYDHCFSHGHSKGQFEARRHQELVHLDLTFDSHLVERNVEFGCAELVESILTDHEVVESQTCEFKFVGRHHAVVA